MAVFVGFTEYDPLIYSDGLYGIVKNTSFKLKLLMYAGNDCLRCFIQPRQLLLYYNDVCLLLLPSAVPTKQSKCAGEQRLGGTLASLARDTHLRTHVQRQPLPPAGDDHEPCKMK